MIVLGDGRIFGARARVTKDLPSGVIARRIPTSGQGYRPGSSPSVQIAHASTHPG